jgi:hypothetical protein
MKHLLHLKLRNRKSHETSSTHGSDCESLEKIPENVNAAENSKRVGIASKEALRHNHPMSNSIAETKDFPSNSAQACALALAVESGKLQEGQGTKKFGHLKPWGPMQEHWKPASAIIATSTHDFKCELNNLNIMFN